MDNVFEIGLQDTELNDEILLVGELMVAATASPLRLSQEQVDAILLASTCPRSR